MSQQHYPKQFYEVRDEGSAASARVVLGLLYKFYRPQSVIDVGCGRGTWLAAAESLGSTTLRGVDGTWAQQSGLASKNIEFECVDFERGFGTGGAYDLCISVEVAEHISAPRSREFVEALCSRSDIVLFSAAIPNQGGTNHINEQWQSYWIRAFAECNYDCFDVFRRAVWEDALVDWWYRQNVFLFIRRNSPKLNASMISELEATQIPDVVHPENYQSKIASFRKSIEYPSLRFCLQMLQRYIAIKLFRLLGKTGKGEGRSQPDKSAAPF
jgi:SAM-dependent methyltransferase